MDLDRIERALRDGPQDEPAYVPGAHRRRRGRAGHWLVTVPAVAVAVLVGLVAGVSLTATRIPGAGAPDPAAIERALPGTWTSPELTFQQWTDGLLAQGFTTDELVAFLAHDGFSDSVRYVVAFGSGRLSVRAEYDSRPPVVLGGGTYEVEEDGTLVYTEVVPGVAPADACSVRMRVAADAASLAIRDLTLVNCAADARLANTAFFGLAPLTRETAAP